MSNSTQDSDSETELEAREDEVSSRQIEYYVEDLFEAVQVMNDLFAEGLGWLDGNEGVLPQETAERVRDLVDRLVDLVSHEIIPHGVSMASRNDRMIKATLRDPSLMGELPNYARVHDLSTGRRAWEPELFEEANVGWNPYDEQVENLTVGEAREVFVLFLTYEKLLLQDVGFNQNSVALIMNRLESRSEEIVDAIRRERGVNSWKYQRALTSMKNAGQRIANPKKGYTLYSSRDLKLIKDKSFSIATIVGDVVPLLVTRDLSVAALVSTIAGATVGGILTSVRPEDGDR